MKGAVKPPPFHVYLHHHEKLNHFIKLLLPSLAVAFLTACGSTQPLGKSGFLPNSERLSKPKDLPFKRAWRDPAIDLRTFGAIQLAPVSTDHLHLSKRDRSDPKRVKKKTAAVSELARYAETTFKRTFDRAEASGKPLVCEIAIVEFEPAKPLANVVGYSLGLAGQAVRQIVVSGGGTVVRSSGARGYIVIEARLRDASTGEVVFMFADAERGRASIVNIKDFQRMGHAKARIRTWAKQCLAAVRKDPEQKIYEEFLLDLKPW